MTVAPLQENEVEHFDPKRSDGPKALRTRAGAGSRPVLLFVCL